MTPSKPQAPSPVFVTFLVILAALAAPIWIPLTMCASIATGRSLKDYNKQANAMSGMEEEAE